MAQLGSGALIIAFALALFGVGAGLFGGWRRIPELVDSSVRAVWGTTFFIVVAVIALLVAFLTHDFHLAYVAGRSSRDMPLYYVAAAFYGGQEGSLLYWSMIAGLLSSLAAFMHRKRDRALIPFFAATVLSVEVFFLVMLNFVSSPFTLLSIAPADGAGLNPLLRDPGMMMHPPFLLGGFSSFTVPFGFAMAAMITGRLGDDWIHAIRRWALVSWGILGCGLLLGAWWAYHVLGWGGYWGWDPVENVALLPWLVSTAFIHSIIVQERRGMLKVWNMALMVAAFCLSVFATFTVRSGLISSVHAFSVSDIGPWFLGYLAIVVTVSTALLIYRLPGLQSERAIESVISRESGFLVNNLLFAAMAFAIFWGTVFPLVSEIFRNTKMTVGPPFYDQVTGPILLALVVLMGIGPLLAWRRSPGRILLRNLLWPVVAGIAAFPFFFYEWREIVPSFAGSAVIFSAATIVLEYTKGAKVRHKNAGEPYPLAVTMLVRKNGRRYGGYIVHLAMAIMAIGIIGSTFFQVERQFTLKPGQSGVIDGYTITYSNLDDHMTKQGQVVGAPLTISQGDKTYGTVEPVRYFYTGFEDQPTARMGITSVNYLNDVYTVLDQWDKTNTISVRVFVNPLVSWIWWGGIVYVLGTLTLLWPAPQPQRRRVTRTVREPALAGAGGGGGGSSGGGGAPE